MTCGSCTPCLRGSPSQRHLPGGRSRLSPASAAWTKRRHHPEVVYDVLRRWLCFCRQRDSARLVPCSVYSSKMHMCRQRTSRPPMVMLSVWDFGTAAASWRPAPVSARHGSWHALRLLQLLLLLDCCWRLLSCACTWYCRALPCQPAACSSLACCSRQAGCCMQPTAPEALCVVIAQTGRGSRHVYRLHCMVCCVLLLQRQSA